MRTANTGNASGGFEARRILAQLGDFEFGTVDLAELHLSTFQVDPEAGYYRAEHIVNLGAAA